MHRELGYGGDGRLLSAEALTAIHWTHRVGALMVICAGGLLALALTRSNWPDGRFWGWLLLGLLSIQLGLGIANVLLSLPLPLAVAHNLGAAALLSATLAINIRRYQKKNPLQNDLRGL